MKLHIGCGDILLDGYINLDIKGKLVTEVSPEELEANRTVLSNYFKYPFGSPRREVIVDKKQNLLERWDFEDESINQMVAVSVIEHFSPKDSQFILSEIKRTLQPNGTLLIDFPDIKKDVELYYDKDPVFLSLLIHCNCKDEYSVHRQTITPDLFKSWWNKEDYLIYEENIIQHSYPMCQFLVIKK